MKLTDNTKSLAKLMLNSTVNTDREQLGEFDVKKQQGKFPQIITTANKPSLVHRYLSLKKHMIFIKSKIFQTVQITREKYLFKFI